MPKVKLDQSEHIVSAWCEYASGPGWGNMLVHVLIRESAGKLRIEYLQPEEQNAEVCTLFGICAMAHKKLMEALQKP